MDQINYKEKYLKYKMKYIELKYGGGMLKSLNSMSKKMGIIDSDRKKKKN